MPAGQAAEAAGGAPATDGSAERGADGPVVPPGSGDAADVADAEASEVIRPAKRPGRAGRREDRPGRGRRPDRRGSGPAGPGPGDRTPPDITAAHPSTLRALLRGRRPARGAGRLRPAPAGGDHPSYDRPAPSAGVNPIGSLTSPGRATVEGRVRAVEIRPVERNSVLAVESPTPPAT